MKFISNAHLIAFLSHINSFVITCFITFCVSLSCPIFISFLNFHTLLYPAHPVLLISSILFSNCVILSPAIIFPISSCILFIYSSIVFASPFPFPLLMLTNRFLYCLIQNLQPGRFRYFVYSQCFLFLFFPKHWVSNLFTSLIQISYCFFLFFSTYVYCIIYLLCRF